MPTYEYRCPAGHQYEMHQPFGSPAEQPCQKCGKPALRVLFAPPLVFKGEGFYKTSSRGDQRIAAQQASGESGPDSSSDSGSSSGDAGSGESATPPAASEAKGKGAEKVAKAGPPAKPKKSDE